MLRELLFTLWGDLEEKKTAYLKKQKTQVSKAVGKSPESNATEANRKKSRAKPGDDLPPDSEDESTPKGNVAKGSSNVDSEGNSVDKGKPDSELSDAILSLPIANKGFTCCIQQYGIKVPEMSYSKADAKGGFRWQRVFGLFGTKIA